MTSRPISPRIAAGLLLLATLGLVGLLARPAAAADWTVETGRQPLRRRPRGLPLHGQPGRAGRGRHRRRQRRHRAAAPRAVRHGRAGGCGSARDDVTVAPGESAEVPFVVALPGDAAPGDYVGGIVASGAGQRVEIPIRLRVGGPLKPSLSVEDVDVHYSGGDATVTYTVHNTGNAILSARQAVSVSGPFGRWTVRAGRLADSPALLPGRALEGVRAAARCHPRAQADGDRHARPAAHRRGGLDRAARRPRRRPGTPGPSRGRCCWASSLVCGLVIAGRRRSAARTR